MDPNACLERIGSALRNGDGLEADFACQDLFDWISRGGFEPDWARNEFASGYYRCRAVHHRAGERVEEEPADSGIFGDY